MDSVRLFGCHIVWFLKSHTEKYASNFNNFNLIVILKSKIVKTIIKLMFVISLLAIVVGCSHKRYEIYNAPASEKKLNQNFTLQGKKKFAEIQMKHIDSEMIKLREVFQKYNNKLPKNDEELIKFLLLSERNYEKLYPETSYYTGREIVDVLTATKIIVPLGTADKIGKVNHVEAIEWRIPQFPKDPDPFEHAFLFFPVYQLDNSYFYIGIKPGIQNVAVEDDNFIGNVKNFIKNMEKNFSVLKAKDSSFLNLLGEIQLHKEGIPIFLAENKGRSNINNYESWNKELWSVLNIDIHERDTINGKFIQRDLEGFAERTYDSKKYNTALHVLHDNAYITQCGDSFLLYCIDELNLHNLCVSTSVYETKRYYLNKLLDIEEEAKRTLLE